MKLRQIASTVSFISLLLVSLPLQANKKQPVDFVNPYVGNISHLLVPTYPMVHLPNSMLRYHPMREDFTEDILNGLPLVMTSHRGISAFRLNPWHGKSGNIEPVYKHSFDNEVIKPYYYEVELDEQDIFVRFAPSNQSAIYEIRYTHENTPQYLHVGTAFGELNVEGNVVSGYQRLTRGTNTCVFLYMEFSETPNVLGSFEDGALTAAKKQPEAKDANLLLGFGKDPRNIQIRYGVSYISVEQAEKNLRREIPDFDLDKVARTGRDVWNETLGTLEAYGSDNDKSIFYTSLYRCYERPICISEDGRYWSAYDKQVHDDGGRPFYTDDWLWDTYRATHPLRILTDPVVETDMIRSLILMAEQSEPQWMPTFPEVTGDSHRMNGNHGVAVVWDAYSKGLTDFDLEAAYKVCKGAMTEKSMLPWTRIPLTVLDEFYEEHGFFPGLNKEEKEWCKEAMGWERRQSVAVTLAMCYDDWCLSHIAKYLGKENEAEYFKNRSFNYRNVYNPETAFFHPKNHDGEFIMPFDYRYDSGPGARDYYDENNAWTYRWDLQHNIGDLVELMGGPEQFVANLDQTFREPIGMHISQYWSFMGDSTGNVGQFTMANEPSLHIPYMYNYAGQPWKTQKRIRTLIREWFRNDLMGVPGDEDGGGLSAFVVFSMMGFYPVTPGSPTYNIGSPMLDRAVINLANGKTFEVVAENYAEENKYIQSATLNGQQWNKPWFSHSDIENGGKLVLVMGRRANHDWGSDINNVPPSGY